MKRLLIFFCLAACFSARAQFDELDDDGPFGNDDDIYKYGLRINNYAGPYAEQFVLRLAREYDVPRSELRVYVRKGFAPSDLLFGLELARRSGYPLRRVMNDYYRSGDRNWIDISVNLGVVRHSIGFRYIVDRFRHQCRYWNDYYERRHPHRRPPVYKHSWSYFRPHAPHPPHRRHGSHPPHAMQPPRPVPKPHPQRGPHRPHVRPRPKPSMPGRSESAVRPSPPDRPDRRDYRRGADRQQSKPKMPAEPEKRRAETSPRPSKGGYRR